MSRRSGSKRPPRHRISPTNLIGTPASFPAGRRLRAAIGKAIAREPKALPFDEPLSNVDAALRAGMRLEIRELQKRLDTKMIHAPHDQIEAMTMADKIVVLQDGAIEQEGSPLEHYRNPRNLFFAGHREAQIEHSQGSRSRKTQRARDWSSSGTHSFVN